MLLSIQDIVATAIVCMISLLGWSALQQEQEHQLKAKKHLIYGTRNEWLPWLRARLRSFKDTTTWVTEGYYKYSTLNTPYMVAALDHGHTLVLPQQQIKKIYNLPEDVLDAHNVQNETMQMHYTFPDRLLNEEPLHNNVIRNQLTRNIPKLTPVVAGEIEFGFERAWGTDQKWKEIRGWSSALRIMAGAANGAFCGQPLCRNTTFLDRLRDHAMLIFGGAITVSCMPKPLQAIFGPMLSLATNFMGHRVTRISRPIVKDRLEKTARWKQDPTFDWTPPEDALQWMIDECYSSPRAEQQLDIDRVAQRLLLVNDVSLLTTAYTAQNILLDLFSTDPSHGYVEELRKECAAALAEAGGVWTLDAVRKLRLVDSALRESMRMNPFGSLLLPRKVASPNGIELEGWSERIPQGTRIALPVLPIHYDEKHYTDPHTYDPFRFVSYKAAQDGSPRETEVKSTVTLDDTFMSFGVVGRNACPGRFFAHLEVKIYIANILLNYDVEYLPQRPEPTYMMWVRYPVDAKLRIRRKATN